MDLDYCFKFLKITGSQLELNLLKKIRKEIEFYQDKKYCIEEIMEMIAQSFKEVSAEFLYSSDKIISALSSSIFIDSKCFINVIGNSKDNVTINENTLFDVASITKMYTGLLLMKLKDLKLIDFNQKIKDISNSFNLNDYSISDLINMHGIIKTPRRIDALKNEDEALEELKHIYVENEKVLYNYTDMGLIVLTLILEEMFDMKYEDLLKKYVLKPLNLSATYHPLNNVTGNGRKDLKPNDPKAVILNRSIGSAGIFTNSLDLALLSKQLFTSKYIDIKDLINFCINKSEKPKGIFGSYTRHPLGLDKTYVPSEYSKYSFSFEGYTGSIVVFDLVNRLHNSILVNAIDTTTGLKNPLFNQKMNAYQRTIVELSLKVLIINKCFENNENFVKKIKI